MPHDLILETLKARFGHSDFRKGQRPIIERALAGTSQLVVLPTGGGKSLLYQLPACLVQGATLVVSPLIALMDDQLRALRKAGLRAESLHSNLSQDQQQSILDRLASGQVDVLLAAPERLTTRRLQQALFSIRVGLFVVDEAHCITEWGADFRPEYRQLAPLIRKLKAPVLALTATATETTQTDICSSLGIPEAIKSVFPLDRSNLRFGVCPIRSEAARLKTIASLTERIARGSVIVYTTSRIEADDLAFRLTKSLQERVLSYHAGLPAETRATRQAEFLQGKVRVLCATSAFGMGIDKPDVRMVIHASPPRSLEDYVQESGRASRDGKPAVCVLLLAPKDLERWRKDGISTARLASLEAFCTGKTCRRRVLLEYFNSSALPVKGVCCDRCNPWRWGWILN